MREENFESGVAEREAARWRILHLEDNTLDRELVHNALRAEGIEAEIRYAASRHEFRQALEADNYDLILSDFTLPGYDGYAALLEAQEHQPGVPYIFVSGTIGEERAVQCLKNGATDYVQKEHLERLLPAIRRAVREARERKQRQLAERALRESEERYRTLFEKHPQPMWVYDLETLRFLAVNEAAARHYGYSREEFLAMTILDIRPPEEAPALLEELKTVRSNPRRGSTRTWRHRRRDGGIIEVEIRSDDLPFAGRPGCVVSANDVTERMMMEERFTTMFHAAPLAMGYGTLEGEVRDANQQLCELLGYSRAELVGRTPQELLLWANPEERAPIMERVRAKTAVRNHETKIRRKSGEFRTCLISMELIRSGNEAVVLVMLVDVTERKTLEAQLQLANRMESVGRLASGIAHDMNNILAPILMAAPLLRLNLAPADVEKTLTTVETSAKRGAALVKQLLMFGRGVEGGRGSVNCAGLIHEISEISGETFPRNITITPSVACDVWPVRGDAAQVHQIVLNLCVNARDAMPQGGTLTLAADNISIDESFASMHPDAQVGPFVRISVADTGTGIPPEIVDRIFDPFFTTKEMGQGTGLGLSTVLGIVKSHGGFMNLSSEVGQGTTFEVYLPAIPDAGSGAAAAESPLPPPSGENELILVVDDEESIRSVLREMLVRHGYRVLLASDGAEATAMFARNLAKVKMVITDLDMPIMDGVSLIQVLQRMKPQTKVLVSTGASATASATDRAAELQSLGVATILTKPYTAEKILTAVHRCFAGQ